MRSFCLLPVFAAALCAADVKVEFNPERPDVGPFPNDYLTVQDPLQKTGIRVNVPLPDCGKQPSDCQELRGLNLLDGFNVQARATVKFSGPVSLGTLRGGVFYVWLDPAWPRQFTIAPPGTMTPVNRLVWNPVSNTLYAKPDDVLEQGRRYAILITDAVTAADGTPVRADEGFQACVDQKIGGEYCVAVSRAVSLVAGSLGGRRVVGGSVFTTLSGTEFLEEARQAADLAKPAVKSQGIFAFANLRSLTLHAQVATSGQKFQDIPFPAPPVLIAAVGIARVSFGLLGAPRYLQDPLQVVPPLPTGKALPPAPTTDYLGFHVYLPSTPPPAGGYPVLLAGHGLGDDRFGGPTLMAATFVPRGYAVVAMNAVGHGLGPETTVLLTDAKGTVELAAPGRGVDLDGDRRIDPSEGCILLLPPAPIGIRDCLRQTAADCMMMVRAIRNGLDVDGDGKADLNGDNISYMGMSLGSFYGTLLMAADPGVKSAVLNVGGASTTETVRLSSTYRPLVQLYFGLRQPALLNRFPDFDEQYAGRWEDVKVLTLPGASEIQEVFERLEWLEASGAPSTYAPHMRSATLDGVPVKRALFQFALGDQTVPNPSNSILLRAANMATASVYRHDLARAVAPQLPANPHAFLAWLLDPQGGTIASAAFAQALGFLQTNLDIVPDVNPMVRSVFGKDLFEPPSILLESTNFQK